MKLITKDCLGCGACFYKCSHKAIDKVINKNGSFCYQINESKCIDCKSCYNVCPQIKEDPRNTIQNYYVAWLNDNEVLKKSSSGGLFYALAKYYIQKGGIVLGAIYDINYKGVRHSIARNLCDLEKMHGSKYVESDISNIFDEVKAAVKLNLPILFSGTPCQCATIKHLFPAYKDLFLLEVICNGVQYPAIFKYMMDFLEKQEQSDIKYLSMRYKKNFHYPLYLRVLFGNGNELIEPFYESFFGKIYGTRISLKAACYTCKFKGNNRYGDMTIGDYHNFKGNEIFGIPALGASSLFVNSKKANEILKEMESINIITTRQIVKTLAYSQNPRLLIQGFSPSKKDKNRFLNSMNQDDIATMSLIVGKYYTKPFVLLRKVWDRIETIIKSKKYDI